MPEIKEIAEYKEWERVSSHSHIKGLGLKDGKPLHKADGMIGQEEAREAAGIVVNLIKQGKFAGRSILIAGPPGTGKTALAIAISRELGKDVPFVPMTASEVFSTEMKKTEFLTQVLRKAIGVRIREMRKIYEGLVKDIEINFSTHPLNPYQQIPESATITLSTQKETKKFTMDQAFAMEIAKQGISKGDVIQIDIDGGHIVKLGRGEASTDISEKTIPIPDGSIFKNKEFVYTLTLHQMDLLNSRRGGDIFSMLFGGGSKEIDSELRRAIDNNVKEMVSKGKAEIIPGVVFIDECSLLDIETFAFLNRAMEEDLAPIIIFATNRGITEIRGTNIKSPHGMPLDLLDRILIINTKKYTEKDIRDILDERCKIEKIEITKDALEFLTQLGVKTSLRHAIQLLAPASQISKVNLDAVKKVDLDAVRKAAKLFVDVKESVKYLEEMSKEFLD